MSRLRTVLLVLAGFGIAPHVAFAAPQVEAKLSAGTIAAGGTVTMLVIVTNPSGGTGDPAFTLPQGLSLLASDRSQSFSWVNGRSTTTVTFQFEVGADTPGDYRIGPIQVRVGSVDYLSDALPLKVTRASSTPLSVAGGASGASGASGAPARLVVEVQPPRPYVGQLVQLSMRLVQTSDLADSRAYSAPATPGFWSESWGEPVEYRAQVSGRSAGVTERRARLYPLAPGTATIGSASLVVLPAPQSDDPFFGPGGIARPVEIRSDSVRVAVRPLPGGAPSGFENAVGDFDVSWGLDRGHTSQDEAVTLKLDVRGTGNLPLLHTPPLDLPDFEVFASTVDDSFAPSGEIAPGRRRFQWTLLPRRAGTLELEAPVFAWFDPDPGAWRTAALPPLRIEVLSARPSAASADESLFPRELAQEPARPGSRAGWPWAFGVTGLILGIAARLWRSTLGADTLTSERAKQREYLRAVGLAHGPDFWRAADEAATWAESRGERVSVLKQDIAVARYGGTGATEDDVRRRLVERIAVCVPAAPARTPRRLLAMGLFALAMAFGWLGWPQPGNLRLADRARAADQLARERKIVSARAEWQRLWDEGGPDAALAARMAWSALTADRVPDAAEWAMRGRAGEARSGALHWVSVRVREAGGLVGAESGEWPIRTLEWAGLAFVCALLAPLGLGRWWNGAALLVLAIGAASAQPLLHQRLLRTPLGVVQVLTPLEGAGIDLDPGQVVHILDREGSRARVHAGKGAEGVVPADAIHEVWAPAP